MSWKGDWKGIDVIISCNSLSLADDCQHRAGRAGSDMLQEPSPAHAGGGARLVAG